MSSGRPYRSELRAERAADTRARIREAARSLFEENGFAATTVAEIARTAGVAAPTVYATFGSKAGVVGAMLEDLEASADRAGLVGRLAATDDPREQLAAFAHWIRTLFERGAPVLRVALAARDDEDVAALRAQGDENRRRGAVRLTEGWADAGGLRPDLPADEAADTLWLLTSPEQFLLATDDLGWSPARYERWLSATTALALLAGGTDGRPG